MQDPELLKGELAACLDSLKQFGSATDLSAVEQHAESISRCFQVLQPLLLRSVGAVPAGTWTQVAAFLKDSRQLHANASLNALRQLNTAAAARGGLQHLPAAAVQAVSQLLRAFLVHAGVSRQTGAPLPRADSPECKACRDLLASSGYDALLAATASLGVTALRGLQPRPVDGPAAAAAAAAARGAQPPPPRAVNSNSGRDMGHLWELAAVVLESCGTLSSLFTSPDTLPTDAKRLQSLALPFVSLAVLMLYRIQAAPGPAAAAAAGGANGGSSSSAQLSAASAASSAQVSGASRSSLRRAAGAARGTSHPQQDAPELTEREGLQVATAMQIAAVFAVRFQLLGCRPSLPTSIPAVLQDSRDLQLLMLVFFALAVQQVHRRVSQPGLGTRSSTPQHAAGSQPPPTAAAAGADHADLLASLGLSRLSAFDGELQAISREVGAPEECDVLQETMYVAADVCMYSYTSRMPATWVTAPAGSTQVPPLPSPAIAAPLLRTLLQYLELYEYRSNIVGLFARIAPGPAAAALRHAGSLLPAAGSSSAVGAQGAQAADAAVREVYEAVLLRLGAVVLEVLHDPDWCDAARKQDLARKWLHLVNVLSVEAPDTSTPMGLISLGQVCSQRPEVVAAVLEAALRCSAVGPYGPDRIGVTPAGADPRLWGFVLPVMTIAQAAASLVDPTSNLSAVAAARPEAGSAMFGLLMTVLKDSQALSSGGLAMKYMPGLVVATTVAFSAVRTADTSFDPLHPAWDVGSSRGLQLFSTTGSSSRAGGGGGGSSAGATSGPLPGSKLLGRQCSLSHLWLVVIGQALRCASRCLLELLHKPTGQQQEALPTSSLANYGPFSVCMYVAVVQWLGVALAQLQLPGEPAAAAAALQLLRQQQADLLAALDLEAVPSMRELAVQPVGSTGGVGTLMATLSSSGALASLMRRAVSREAASKGLQLGAGLCSALPLPLWCNDPACTALDGASERLLVRSKGACSGCRQAKYCSRACQMAHWKDGHKAACKRLQQAAAAAAGSTTSGAPAGASHPAATFDWAAAVRL